MPNFKRQEVIERIIGRCIATKVWRSECSIECMPYVADHERIDFKRYLAERYDSAGAGFSGRWQTGRQ